jgi:hypothetical protein
MDIRDNPYRLKADSYRHSPSLLHATLALSFQHLAKQQNCKDMEEQTHRYRSAAIHGFSRALMDSRGPSLLDTLLTLVNLEVSSNSNLVVKIGRDIFNLPTDQSISSWCLECPLEGCADHSRRPQPCRCILQQSSPPCAVGNSVMVSLLPSLLSIA